MGSLFLFSFHNNSQESGNDSVVLRQSNYVREENVVDDPEQNLLQTVI